MSILTSKYPLVLGSSSPARRQLLTDLTVPFTWQASDFDEETAKIGVTSLPIAEQCRHLADGKALSISRQQPESLVLAADQMGEFDGKVLSKPHTVANNVAMLQQLSGKRHWQHSAACLYHRGECIQRFYECIELVMQPLSKAEIEAYVQADQPMRCCGGYRFEALGRCLFAQVSGSTEGVMGLPLQSIVAYLCSQKYVFWV
jgi:septum formation protein